ncbi:MAG: siphovirus ReqiPepy6 Gp37-like family protein [Bulleidia sp.]
MMNLDVRFYDRSMQLLGFCEGITSLQWNRKYNTMGSFEIHCMQNNMQYVSKDGIIWLSGAVEAGVIESVKLISSTSKRDLILKGRFLSSYLDRRLVKSTYNATDKPVTSAMRECFENAEPLGGHILLCTVVDDVTKTTFQATYKNLLEVEQSCAQKADLGMRFRPDFEAKKIYFEIYKGVDRSINQSERPRVVFAPRYKNIDTVEFERIYSLEKTVCYVGGQGEGEKRTIATAGDDTLAGLDRRELFLEATDVSKAKDMTDDDYINALQGRGDKALEESKSSETFNADVDPLANFKYKTDYDLGDIVTIQYPDWGILIDKRLTEISEVYEKGALKIKPTFGKDLLITTLGGITL